jgi:hypothetical protein
LTSERRDEKRKWAEERDERANKRQRKEIIQDALAEPAKFKDQAVQTDPDEGRYIFKVKKKPFVEKIC